jgi:hypothetical protein
MHLILRFHKTCFNVTSFTIISYFTIKVATGLAAFGHPQAASKPVKIATLNFQFNQGQLFIS